MTEPLCCCPRRWKPTATQCRSCAVALSSGWEPCRSRWWMHCQHRLRLLPIVAIGRRRAPVRTPVPPYRQHRPSVPTAPKRMCGLLLTTRLWSTTMPATAVSPSRTPSMPTARISPSPMVKRCPAWMTCYSCSRTATAPPNSLLR